MLFLTHRDAGADPCTRARTGVGILRAKRVGSYVLSDVLSGVLD